MTIINRNNIIYNLEVNNKATVLGFSDIEIKDINIKIPETIEDDNKNKYIVETIGTHAFMRTSIENITIPKSVKIIDIGAFSFSKLKTITIESESLLETIGNSAFEETLIENIIIPKSVKNIDISAFLMSKLKKVKFLGDVPQIGKHAFIAKSDFFPILGEVDKKTYPNWSNINKIDDLYIGFGYNLNIILKIVALLLLLVSTYYMTKSNMTLGIITIVVIIISIISFYFKYYGDIIALISLILPTLLVLLVGTYNIFNSKMDLYVRIITSIVLLALYIKLYLIRVFNIFFNL